MSLLRKTQLLCILGSLAMLSTAVCAGAPAAPKASPEIQDQTQEKRKALMADATSAIGETQNALKQLDGGKKQDALAAASETVVSVTNIPLATYPLAIKDAVKLIDQNKLDDATRVLQTALNTQVLTETVIPLPLVNAQESLKTAEILAEKKDRSKEENTRLSAALNKARNQLAFAQALGYGTKADFEKFYRQISEIEQKTADNQFGSGFFAKIKASIADLFKSNQSAK